MGNLKVRAGDHRADDECFLIVHAERCNDTQTFLYKAQRWQDTWNFARHHFGKGMKGLTPNQKLKQSKSIINEHIQIFPTFLMENLFKFAGSYFNSIMLRSKSGGKYVYTTCPSIEVGTRLALDFC